ncbi:type IX secretion system anionic LPS delivery protein PorZ [Neolewinella antarctica]|uniref:PorZ N-terminal beta-propeller domain-containing protein n=1 Tax=Neolewinella antarctica TaxID=442734 RepID=A0ABX0XD17_9BACT|nr:hypothetical protein [Neolewinella antarctica]NJC27191.1 hypothetical protein [Neolewinella antarctica]
MLRNFLIAFAILISFATAPIAIGAQDSLARSATDSLGEWRTLQSYTRGTYVTESENSIIYTTGRAIFYLDKDDLSITTLAREDGLADARIRLLRYHQPTETLLIVYESGVIDLLRDNRFTTLRQIDNFNFNGDKTIYSLFFGENDIVYISAGFGVTALDLKDETFPFTTFTGVRVNGSAEHEGFLYAATEEGVYRVPRNDDVNLNDFGNWTLLGQRDSLPGDYSSTVINVYRGRLYFSVGTDIYVYVDGTARLFFDEDDDKPHRVEYLTVGPNFLLAGYRCTDLEEGCSARQITLLDESGPRRTFSTCVFFTRYAIEDSRGRIWFGEDYVISGIRYFDDAESTDCNTVRYGGPTNDQNNRLLHDGTSLWVAPSVLNENFGPIFDFFGVYRFNDRSWRGINRDNTAAFLGKDGVRGGDNDVASIVDVHYDPINKLHWFSSFYEGAIAYDEATDEGTLFDETNSTLSETNGDPNRIRVAGAVTDANGFTYLANSAADDGAIIAVRSPEGEWADLGKNCGLNRALAVEIDPNGYLWVIHAKEGITVLDPMGTPMDPSDDRCRTITTNNSQLPNNIVRSIEVDLQGVVWVGTSAGVVLFECANDVFNTERCTGRRPVATADDFGASLLETEEVLSITTDGGNRKWIGTNGGAYLLSENGEEQLLFFDSGNSPLLDNTVRDVAIDPTTGVIYFGTELGIISYRGDATSAERGFASELVVFPNPVEPGYDGPIAIQGLSRNARVKITDVSGKLIDTGTAIGGQYVWGGADYTGRRVQTGVYLVFASSNQRFSGEDATSAVGKIVFVR